jgi:tellurium resistance protein TerD
VELARFDLTEDASADNGLIFGELCREGIGWKFRAIGIGTAGGLYKLARDYNVNVAAP